MAAPGSTSTPRAPSPVINTTALTDYMKALAKDKELVHALDDLHGQDKAALLAILKEAQKHAQRHAEGLKVKTATKRKCNATDVFAGFMCDVRQQLDAYNRSDNVVNFDLNIPHMPTYDNLADTDYTAHHEVLSHVHGGNLVHANFIVYEKGRLYAGLRKSNLGEWTRRCTALTSICPRTAQRYIGYMELVSKYPRVLVLTLAWTTVMTHALKLDEAVGCDPGLLDLLTAPIRTTTFKCDFHVDPDHYTSDPTRVLEVDKVKYNPGFEYEDAFHTKQDIIDEGDDTFDSSLPSSSSSTASSPEPTNVNQPPSPLSSITASMDNVFVSPTDKRQRTI